jgi:hypothetical protein
VRLLSYLDKNISLTILDIKRDSHNKCPKDLNSFTWHFILLRTWNVSPYLEHDNDGIISVKHAMRFLQ